MTTPWTLPSTVSQYAETEADSVHVAWDNFDNFSALKNLDLKSLGTIGYLEHISRSPKPDIKNKTWYLRATGFSFVNLPTTITGIEARVSARRYGRVVDDTVQLCFNGNSLGENQAELSTLPAIVYGSPTSNWGAGNLTLENLQDSSFGIIVRFQAHPHWPHRSPIYLDAIEIRIH